MHRGWPIVVALAVGCGGATTHGAPPKPTPPMAPAEIFATPARWMFEPNWYVGSRDLGPLGILHFGHEGERWVGARRYPHEPVAAAFTPESLVGATLAPGGAIWLVGETGTIFETAQLLGAVRATRAPLPGTSLVTAGKSAIVGVRGSALWRTIDGGAHWTPVAIDLGARAIAAVEMLPSGGGVILAFPQRVLATSDDGATWSPLATPEGLAISGWRVDRRGDGDSLVVTGKAPNPKGDPTKLPLSERSFRLRERPLRWEDPALLPAEPESDDQPRIHWNAEWERGPPGIDGLFVGDRLVRARKEPSVDGVELYAHTLGELASTDVKLAKIDQCTKVVLGTERGTVIAACHYRDDTRIHRSEDGGRTFRFIAAIPEFAPAYVTPTAGGEVVVGCRGKGECDRPPDGIRTRLAGSTSFVRAKSNVPIDEVRFARTTSDDAIYTLGVATAGSTPAILVSKDGGVTFTARLLPKTPDASELVPSALSLDARGSVSCAFTSLGRHFVFRPDGADGFARSEAPEGETLSLVGRHGLVRGYGAAFETADAGEHWTQVDDPLRILIGATLCGVPGCIFGDGTQRLGWELAKPSLSPLAPPKREASAPPSKVELALATPLRCKATDKWQVANANDVPYPLVGSADPVPGIRWMLPSGRDAIVIGRTTKGGLVLEKKALLDPEKSKSWMAGGVNLVRGGAYAYRTMATSPTTRTMEIGWYVASNDKLHHGKVTLTGSQLRVYSVDVGGVHVGDSAGNLWFLDANGTVKKRNAWHSSAHDFLDVFRLGNGAQVASTSENDANLFFGDDKAFHALGLWYRTLPKASVSTTMVGTTPTVVLTTAGSSPRTILIGLPPIVADAPTVDAGPTLESLGDPPVACGPNATTGARMVVPATDASRHVVEVVIDGKASLLESEDGIVRVASATPSGCATALSARGESYFALIPLDDLAHASLFDNRAIHVRPMACAYAKGWVPPQPPHPKEACDGGEVECPP